MTGPCRFKWRSHDQEAPPPKPLPIKKNANFQDSNLAKDFDTSITEEFFNPMADEEPVNALRVNFSSSTSSRESDEHDR
eukprot:COSAG02_NODE_8578_length_2517_cov_1.485112_3_plen_79_part_00